MPFLFLKGLVPALPAIGKGVPSVDEILTVEEVAAYLKVSNSTIRRWCLKAKLPAFKIEREWRIHKKELDRLIRQSSCGPGKAEEDLSQRQNGR